MNDLGIALKDTVFLMPNWKWVNLAGLFVLGFLLSPILKRVVQFLQNSDRVQRLHGLLRHLCQRPIAGPLAWILVTLVWHVGFDSLDLPPKLEKFVFGLDQLIQTYFLIRFTYVCVDAVGLHISESFSRKNTYLSEQVVLLATRSLKIMIIVFGSLIFLQDMGFNVMHLLAGLGLGGLALALAAQDTAANLFGSVTIVMDQPFQVGDWIKVGDTEGTVEDIGFRSTRIRTFYQSLITVPNSIMAKEKIDNMGLRPSRRIRHVLGLSYDTTNDKIQEFIENLRALAANQPFVIKDSVLVSLQQLADSNVSVLAQFFIAPANSADEPIIQQNFLLQVKELAEAMGVEFAFPTQTIRLQSEHAGGNA